MGISKNRRAGRLLAPGIRASQQAGGWYKVSMFRASFARQLSVADEEVGETESGEVAEGRYCLAFTPEYATARALTRTLRLTRSSDTGPDDEGEDAWDAEFEVSAEDAEDLLWQLEDAPETQVFFDFGEDEDLQGKVRATVDVWRSLALDDPARRLARSNYHIYASGSGKAFASQVKRRLSSGPRTVGKFDWVVARVEGRYRVRLWQEK